MKTIEAFIKEIEGSAALKDELKAIQDNDALAAFLKKYDVSGTVEDFVKAIQTKAGVCRMWPGGTPGQNFRADFCAQLDRNGVWRIWRGGDVRQNHQAVFSAKPFSVPPKSRATV